VGQSIFHPGLPAILQTPSLCVMPAQVCEKFQNQDVLIFITNTYPGRSLSSDPSLRSSSDEPHIGRSGIGCVFYPLKNAARRKNGPRGVARPRSTCLAALGSLFEQNDAPGDDTAGGRQPHKIDSTSDSDAVGVSAVRPKSVLTHLMNTVDEMSDRSSSYVEHIDPNAA